MIAAYIEPILYVTGALTASMLLQFAAPGPVLRAFNGLEVHDDVALFFARASALPIALFGVLLIWAAIDPAIRTPVMVVVAIGKAGFVGVILTRIKDFAGGYLLTAVFDSLCVVTYGAYLAYLANLAGL